ncbi:serine protease inhibitor dipetalogastin-like [Saccostrea cucullata]|uniref:serine protease inhibitor dipetalogastin-like n=1 Tax=Saccostrea cuccullata TaxID=36930 RepID=UPI002ECFBC13
MQYGILAVCVILGVLAVSDSRSPPRPSVCNMDYRPVCGKDNKTYSNACRARAAGVPIASQGKCKVCPCQKIMKPVCGVNEVTYDNECLANCAGVTFFPGPCKRS